MNYNDDEREQYEPEHKLVFDDAMRYYPQGYDDERDNPQGFYDEMWVPTQWEEIKYYLLMAWWRIRHQVLRRLSKRYRDRIDDIQF